MPICFDASIWNRFKNEIYFETGLFKGDSLAHALKSKQFNRCISLEISQSHVRDARSRFALQIKNKKARLIHGNSKNLSKHIGAISHPITFFLDAHDDQRIDPKSMKKHDDPKIGCPLFHELEAIAKHPFVDEHIILVDDMRCFKEGFSHETHSWWKDISYQDIIDKVKSLFPNHCYYCLDSYRENDILVITPRQPSIPKIIHQTYKNTKLPVLYKECQKKIKNCYMDFDYRFYNDEDIIQFMTEHYERFKVRVFDKLPTFIMKLDVFRYCLLQKFGGIYADMDYEFLQRYEFRVEQKSDDNSQGNYLFVPLSRDKVIKVKDVSLKNRFSRKGNYKGKRNNKIQRTERTFGNCVLASTPDHPFWRSVLNGIEKNLPEILKHFKNGKYQHSIRTYKKFILQHTGPEFLTSVLEKYIKPIKAFGEPVDEVIVIQRMAFHPPKEKVNKKDPNIFGFHHCSETWLKHTK